MSSASRMLSASMSLNSPLALKVLNGVLFNISWFAVVVGNSIVPAPIVVGVHLAIHFALMGRGRAELGLIACVSVLGVLMDQLLFALGVFVVDGQATLPPVWLSCLWPIFATTLAHAFSGFQGRMVLSAVLGVLGGGGSFVAGTRLSEVDFADPFWGAVILASLWAVMFPLLMMMAARMVPNSDDENATA